MDASDTIDTIFALLGREGQARYGGEAITQLAHGLQSAQLAEREGAAPALVGAALLHDIGHLLDAASDDATVRGVDLRHEAAGARYLARFFETALTAPVALHVAAKRYLCATVEGYVADLSDESIRSLALQGGPMSDAEIAAFRSRPWAEEAVRLRRWDDEAKVVGLETPPLEHYRAALRASLLAEPRGA